MRAKVAERGQVTIPLALRKKLGIRPGVILDFEIEKGKLVAMKAEQRDPVAQVYGCIGKGLDTDSFIRELRGEE